MTRKLAVPEVREVFLVVVDHRAGYSGHFSGMVSGNVGYKLLCGLITVTVNVVVKSENCVDVSVRRTRGVNMTRT